MMATEAQESKKAAFDAYYLASAHRTCVVVVCGEGVREDGGGVQEGRC